MGLAQGLQLDRGGARPKAHIFQCLSDSRTKATISQDFLPPGPILLSHKPGLGVDWSLPQRAASGRALNQGTLSPFPLSGLQPSRCFLGAWLVLPADKLCDSRNPEHHRPTLACDCPLSQSVLFKIISLQHFFYLFNNWIKVRGWSY